MARRRSSGSWLAVLVAIVIAIALWRQQDDTQPAADSSAANTQQASTPDPAGLAGLPDDARETLALIAAGGPFPYDRDGTVFHNRERRLPERPRGYYREYTVPTPGERDRGARRIVTGGNPPEVYYYTDDHYETFRRLEGVNGRR
jgi:guanyl-specific ribonuclease Sa